MTIKRFIGMLILTVILFSFAGCDTTTDVATFIPVSEDDDLVFIHHSCGENWLNNSLNNALLAKDYIDERNDITYGTSIKEDVGRINSLGLTPGDYTDMHVWIRWFNDYLGRILSHDSEDGENRIVMFKSCYPNNAVTGVGSEDNPFSAEKTLRNYQAIFAYPDGVNSYERCGTEYKALEQVFAENPNTLFIFVTAPPQCWAEAVEFQAANARTFYNWLKNNWLNTYNAENPGLDNVAIFDWFDFLAYPDDHVAHPNMLKQEYGGASGDSHPNTLANSQSTQLFASGPGNKLDEYWNEFIQ